MTEETVTTTEAAPAATLTISDLLLALNFIQVCAQRGAIKAEELTQVGNLHDRLYKFLDEQGALKQPAAPAESAESTEATAEASA